MSDPVGDKLAFLRQAQAAGYKVIFNWVRIETIELSIARVMQRVESGGHDVPDEKLEARFPRTWKNASAAPRWADIALEIDNSGVERPFRLVEAWRR